MTVYSFNLITRNNIRMEIQIDISILAVLFITVFLRIKKGTRKNIIIPTPIIPNTR